MPIEKNTKMSLDKRQALDETKMKAIVIFDIIGKPAEHLVETLEQFITAVDNEKGINVLSKNIKEPVSMKEQEGFYTTFAEVEVEIEEFLYLFVLLFKYMPAHIEIVYPEIIAFSNNGWNDILNELARRLHGYDEIARMMQIEKEMLLKKIHELGGEIPQGVQQLSQTYFQDKKKEDQKDQEEQKPKKTKEKSISDKKEKSSKKPKTKK